MAALICGGISDSDNFLKMIPLPKIFYFKLEKNELGLEDLTNRMKFFTHRNGDIFGVASYIYITPINECREVNSNIFYHCDFFTKVIFLLRLVNFIIYENNLAKFTKYVIL
jgi:hypothetical protein